MESLSLDAKIEALLFYKGEPVSFKVLASSFKVSEDEIKTALGFLKDRLAGGVTLVMNDTEASLGTTPALSSFFEDLRKEELSKELSRASLETLSIVLYKQKVSRADIDFIRGVNSSFILRNLAMRGLVDKEIDPKDARSFVYRPSVELLAHLGVSEISELPDYAEVSKTLTKNIEEQSHEHME